MEKAHVNYILRLPLCTRTCVLLLSTFLYTFLTLLHVQSFLRSFASSCAVKNIRVEAAVIVHLSCKQRQPPKKIYRSCLGYLRELSPWDANHWVMWVLQKNQTKTESRYQLEAIITNRTVTSGNFVFALDFTSYYAY